MRICTSLGLVAVLFSAGGSLVATGPPARRPSVRVIHLPDIGGDYAIWGATGADLDGRIWIGITTNDDRSASAHLIRYDPATDTIDDQGNVLDELRRLHLGRDGEKQMKIHSRIVQMPDGYLYFSSMDESGERDDGSRPPTWGGHLWRIGSTGSWEHLARTDEAPNAIAAGGRYVYALAYFNNVLYQYDTKTGALASRVIGTLGGHVTRNFFADDRGHAFVPRVTRSGEDRVAVPSASLVELDTALNEIGSVPLPEYFNASPNDSHGIVATHPDGAGGWYFASSKGRLYHEEAKAEGPARVTDMGWYHPDGPYYVPSMFRDPSSGTLYGVAYRTADDAKTFEWVAHRLDGKATVVPLLYGDVPFPHGAVLYGSMTRDTQGRFYVVGSMAYKPVVLQVTP